MMLSYQHQELWYGFSPPTPELKFCTHEQGGRPLSALRNKIYERSLKKLTVSGGKAELPGSYFGLFLGRECPRIGENIFDQIRGKMSENKAILVLNHFLFRSFDRALHIDLHTQSELRRRLPKRMHS